MFISGKQSLSMFASVFFGLKYKKLNLRQIWYGVCKLAIKCIVHVQVQQKMSNQLVKWDWLSVAFHT